ncbi:MAG: SMI1/KNR4 family protein [Spirochaetes bacterium]|nr:SMI1/KNR4 family protein [Spirochaetota bacterium]
MTEDANLDFWEKLFDSDCKIYNKNPPMTADEINAELKFCEEVLAGKTFPPSYINFKKFCNIDEMENGERYFQFFSLKEICEGITAYEFPVYMNGAISFAMNGGGVHYVFDTREKSPGGEYNIYAVSSGNLGWDKDQAFFLGNSFVEVITAKTNIEELMF